MKKDYVKILMEYAFTCNYEFTNVFMYNITVVFSILDWSTQKTDFLHLKYS